MNEGHSHLPNETLIRLFLNGKLFAHLLCTPVNLKELAVGWLLGQGIITGVGEIVSLGVCDEQTDLAVHLKSLPTSTPGGFEPVLSSGCSGGQINVLNYFKDLKVVESTLTAGVGECRRALALMFRRLNETCDGAGVHCAAAVSGGREDLVHFAYDIGRHNAVDKVIGAALLKSVDFSQTILATSGRISSDMVVKAALAGIPMLVSPRSVTTLATGLAEKAGIGIVGRLGKKEMVILGNTSRILG